jgi:phage terminase large subunit-like protein
LSIPVTLSSLLPPKRSRAEWIASLPVSERQACLSGLDQTAQAAALYNWRFWARPGQCAPAGLWRIWLLLAGRGFGKTRSGAEWVRERIGAGARRIALVAPTPADARDVMVEGESGLLAVAPAWDRPSFEPSKRRMTWPNGAQATIYSGFEPDQLRGPQHDTAWCDELASWKYAQETWDNLQFGMRLGDDPRICVTTTPKPITLLRQMKASAHVAVTIGSTYENRSNLPDAFFEEIVAKYEGTTLGQQELHAALLDEAPGALLKRSQIEAGRVSTAPGLRRIVVAIDPAVTSTEESSETGIVVAGLGDNGHAYVLDDLSGRISPDSWGRRAVGAYQRHKADRIIGEQNNGGDMVRHTIMTVDPQAAYKAVTASKGKHTRAEPVAALYEQGKVHHVGVFPQLEDQWCTWTPGEDSPDRLDACVWALSELLLHRRPSAVSPGGTMQHDWRQDA